MTYEQKTLTNLITNFTKLEKYYRAISAMADNVCTELSKNLQYMYTNIAEGKNAKYNVFPESTQNVKNAKVLKLDRPKLLELNIFITHMINNADKLIMFNGQSLHYEKMNQSKIIKMQTYQSNLCKLRDEINTALIYQ